MTPSFTRVAGEKVAAVAAIAAKDQPREATYASNFTARLAMLVAPTRR